MGHEPRWRSKKERQQSHSLELRCVQCFQNAAIKFPPIILGGEFATSIIAVANALGPSESERCHGQKHRAVDGRPGRDSRWLLTGQCTYRHNRPLTRLLPETAFLGTNPLNSLLGEFISISKEVIGMAMTCKDKVRAVPKVIRSGV